MGANEPLPVRDRSRDELSDQICGVLIGTAVGDSIGLPGEGISAKRLKRLWGGHWRHRFVFGRGMISDDTEHTLFVAQALLSHPQDAERFRASLAWKLRWWMAGLPAGIGLATARAIFKLWLGFPGHRSGVFSAGNGPAMRSAILGACFVKQPDQLREFVSASTRLTHTDPKAEIGALAVAHAVAWEINVGGKWPEFLGNLKDLGPNDDWQSILNTLEKALESGSSVAEFARQIGCEAGVSGYIFHTVPVAIFAWIRHHGDFRQTVESVLNCGGDTDTSGATAGALAGATVGLAGIPAEWRDGIVEWPRSCTLLEQVGRKLAQQSESGIGSGQVNYFWPALLPRNLLFLVIVLLHGFRRLLPPY